MPTLSVAPLPAPAGSVVTVAGSGFPNAKTRLALDGAGATTNVFRPAKDGTFRVGITVASSAKSQTLTAEQQTTGGSWKLVARLAPLLTFLPPAGADTTPPVITNISASNITPTSALINWTTNEPATTRVEYGPTTSYGSFTTLDSTKVTNHSQQLTGLTPGSASSFAEVLTTFNPTSWWRLGEASGTLVDSIAAANGTAFNTPTYGSTTTLGDSNKGMTFSNASAEYVEIAYQSSLNIGDTFTIGFRFKRTGSGGGNVRHVLGRAGGITYGVMFAADDTIRLIAADGSNFDIVASTGAYTDTNEHLCIITKAGSTRKMYVDGSDVTDLGTNVTLNDTTGLLRIAAYATSTSNSFDGMLDEVFLIGGTAISSAQVTTLTNAQPNAGGSSSTYHYRVISADAASNSSTSGDNSFATASSSDVTPPVISAIAATQQTSTSYAITWTTNEGATGQVLYGPTSSYGSLSTLATAYTTSHSITIGSLTPGATYHYAVRSLDGAGNSATSSDQTFTVPSTGTSVLTLGPSTSAAAFAAAVANTSYDIIELDAGTYAWDGYVIEADRTSRPLTIRPKAGVTCTFVGDGATSEGIFFVGLNSWAKYITFDGTNGAGGRGFVFDGYELACAGSFEVRSTDHCTFRALRFKNIRRSTTIGDDPQPYKTWMFYVSMGGGARWNADLLIDDIIVERPPTNRNHAFANNGSSTLTNGNITFTNINLTGVTYGMYCDVANNGAAGGSGVLTLSNWTMTDCGWSGDPSSIRTTAKVINGTYTNIVATGSDPLHNQSTGSFTSGGGNSGI